jgi:hypothetical protein
MKFRKPLKITSRTSSITNSFVQAIIPNAAPTEAELQEILQFFGMTADNKKCVYCGTYATDWDHLRPLVRAKRPTGFLNEPRNIVPACGPCNQSKSGADWQKWIVSTAKGSPATKKVGDLDLRVQQLQAFEQWGNISALKFEEVISPDVWHAYWELHAEIIEKMKAAQLEADKIRLMLMNQLAGHQAP